MHAAHYRRALSSFGSSRRREGCRFGVDRRRRQLDYHFSGRGDPPVGRLHLRQVPGLMFIPGVQIAFYYLAAAAVTSAAVAVTRRNPVHSILWVLSLFLHVAGLFLLVGAEFLAAVQITVYAGAILVFYLFFMMLLDLQAEE